MKRIISILLCLTLHISFPAVMSAQETEETAKMQEITSILTKLDIVDITAFERDKSAPVTRAEFVSYAASLLKLVGTKDKRYFNDVSSEHWALGYINSMVEMGAISLADDGRFNPDDNVTYEQACKILMVVTGYRELASPSHTLTKYVQLAHSTGVGISYDAAAELTFGAALEMLYNALTVEMARMEYEGDKAENILSAYYSGYVAQGTVDSVYGLGIDNRVHESGYAYISGEKFTVDDDVVLEDYFGETIKFVYIENRDEGTKKIIFAKPKYSDYTHTIQSVLMESFDKKTGELRYYASETAKKTKTITIPKKAVYVYNGTPLQGALEDKLTEFINGSRKGSIKIIESTDAQYARVIIKSYETIIAKAYENYVLYDAYDADKNINIKGYDVVRIRSKYESDIALPQTFPNAFSVAKSEDGTVLEIYVTEENQKKVTQHSQDTVTLDDEKYRIDKSQRDNIMKVLSLNDSVRVKLDIFGEIVYAEKTANATEFQLGYITKMGLSDNALENILTIRVFQKNTGFSNFDIKDILVIDGKRYDVENINRIVSAFPGTNTYDGQSKIYITPQLIRFRVNAENIVKEIDTYNPVPGEDKNYTLTRTADGEKKLLYWGEDNRYGSLDIADSNTLVLSVPSVDANGFATIGGEQVKPTEDMYAVGASVSIDKEYYIEAYYYTNRFIADAIIVKYKDAKLSGTLCMFDELTTIWNESTECAQTQFVGYTKGGKVTYTVADVAKDDVNALTRGDIVRVGTLVADPSLLTTAIKHFDVKTMDFVGSTSSKGYLYVGASLRSDYNLVKMYPYDTRGTILRSSYKLYDAADDISDMAVNTAKTKVIVYDKELRNNNIYEGTINDIKTYKMYDENCDMVLYNVSGVTSPVIFVIRR